MKEYLSEESINKLIVSIHSGDEEAWEILYKNFEDYVHECAWKRLRGTSLSAAAQKEMEPDLYQAGWRGFVHAIKNYEPGKAKLITFATYYIDGELNKEFSFLMNSMGITELPKPVKKEDGSKDGEYVRISRAPIEFEDGSINPEVERLSNKSKDESNVNLEQDGGSFATERETIQILGVLRMLTDENHTLNSDELVQRLILYRNAKYKNGNLISFNKAFQKTIAEIIMELNPAEHTDYNDTEYRIKYEGYEKDKLNERKYFQKKNPQKIDTDHAPVINGLSYVHIFNNDELDRLIQLVCFSDMFDIKEKERLVEKLISTASLYYRTPFWDDGIKFNPKAVQGRLSERHPKGKEQFVRNLKTIQNAVNNLVQIRFKFNQYTEDHKMVPKSDYTHILSPYHLVVYHDNYYCIGLKQENNDKRIWHYRVDLMSEVEILKDDNGKDIPIKITAFEGIPIFNAYWDPAKYMAEHLNMAYDEPRDICIKIKNDDYTILHDWFGDHYEKADEIAGTDDKGNEVRYDIVKVRTSPSMIVHWAMQYGTNVEIMDEEIREKIKEEADKVRRLYD